MPTKEPSDAIRPSDLLTYEEAAQICKVGVRTIQYAVFNRELTVTYPSPRRPRIERADLERYLQRKKKKSL